jgi:hypothetical protein
VEEHSTHNPEIKGLNPAIGAGNKKLESINYFTTYLVFSRFMTQKYYQSYMLIASPRSQGKYNFFAFCFKTILYFFANASTHLGTAEKIGII